MDSTYSAERESHDSNSSISDSSLLVSEVTVNNLVADLLEGSKKVLKKKLQEEFDLNAKVSGKFVKSAIELFKNEISVKYEKLIKNQIIDLAKTESRNRPSINEFNCGLGNSLNGDYEKPNLQIDIDDSDDSMIDNDDLDNDRQSFSKKRKVKETILSFLEKSEKLFNLSSNQMQNLLKSSPPNKSMSSEDNEDGEDNVNDVFTNSTNSSCHDSEKNDSTLILSESIECNEMIESNSIFSEISSIEKDEQSNMVEEKLKIFNNEELEKNFQNGSETEAEEEEEICKVDCADVDVLDKISNEDAIKKSKENDETAQDEQSKNDQIIDRTSDNEDKNEPNFSKINRIVKNANKALISDSESDGNDSDNIPMTRARRRQKDNPDDEDSQTKILLKKSRKRLISDDEIDKNFRNSSDDSSDGEPISTGVKNRRKKRRRVILNSSDDEDDNNSDSSDNFNVSRKRIKKIKTDSQLKKVTLKAEAAEKERRTRIEEKQKLYNNLSNKTKDLNTVAVPDEIILDRNDEEILVKVHEAFVKCLKTHQIEGIKFLYDCTIETIDRLKKDFPGSGCILAHSMGLGKTFQVISFLHTIMTSEHIKNTIKRVLILVPYNVIKNWSNEFEKWFEQCNIDFEIPLHDLIGYSHKARVHVLKKWHNDGGIILISTNMFSNMISKGKPKMRKMLDKYLLEPDLVIIDEGHLLKNEKSLFNQSVSQIKTPRRVILTGTPLQNNLFEYYTMVSFVKPNLLGTKDEFKNRFENPIKNGEHIDSTPFDVKLMKERAHILHGLLNGCIHRRDYGVLVPHLQPKFEYVISIRLSKTQTKIYKHYLDNYTRETRNGHPNLFHDYHVLSLVWNHPALLYKHKEQQSDDEETNSMDDFITHNDESDSDETLSSRRSKVSEDSDSEIECIYEGGHEPKQEPAEIVGSSNEVANLKLPPQGWYEQFLPADSCQIELSSKFELLFSILEKCEIIGDKVLVFSQSLSNLNLIERLLNLKMKENIERYGSNTSYAEIVEKNNGISHRWIPEIDYFRIDGNVNCQTRTKIIHSFNDPENHRARLMLVSTKAGGIGINLIGANRCIIFDVSWNPTNDLQAIFRIFRYGQVKPVYVYRFTAFGTMESKIYERQIVKQSLSRRVVDEKQIQRYFKSSEISELYSFTEHPDEDPKIPNLPKDNLLADIFLKHKNLIISYHEHDSLLENRPDEDLTEEERKAAWEKYEKEKIDRKNLQEAYLNNALNPGSNLLQNQQRDFSLYQPQNSNREFLQSLVSPSLYPYQNFLTNAYPDNQSNMAINNILSKENIVKISGIEVNINLNRLIRFIDKNIDFFENEFYTIFSQIATSLLQSGRVHFVMFQFSEACMRSSVDYRKKLVKYNNNINLLLHQCYNSLRNIHVQLLNKYRNLFNKRNKMENSTSKTNVLENNFTSASTSSRAATSNQNVECITLSDSEL